MARVRGPWDEVLDTLDRDIQSLEVALREGHPVAVETWRPPADAGPIPSHLLGRAARIVAHLDQLRGRVAEHVDELRGELTDLERRRGAGAAYAASAGHGGV